MQLSRRSLVGLLASAAALPGTALADDRPCYVPKYESWTRLRERRWPDRVGGHGFVNYYGEAFSFDERIDLPRDTYPSCALFGSEAGTLDNGGRVRDHLRDLTVRGEPASTDCHVWPSETALDFQRNVARLVEQMSAACPVPARPAPVRFTAVGSHHSSSDVYKRVDETKSFVVRIDGLNQILLHRDEWRTDFAERRQVERDLPYRPAFGLVGAGITVCQLNEALWEKGLAIETQGSFDGQTLAGAISTGTHGAGAEHGAIADSVEAVLVLTCLRDASGAGRWELLQVEPDPDDAISDATRFVRSAEAPPWRLVQDRALFEALLVGMGTLGVIVGYVMRVRPFYFLRELRVGRPWNEVKHNLVERATTPATGFGNDGWRYELVVNPSQIEREQDWVCTEVYRDAWSYDLDYLSSVREIPQKWAGDFTRNVNLGGALGNVVGRAANGELAKGKRVGLFADRAYRVLKLGQGEFVQAWGAEFMVPAERGAEMVQWILDRNPEVGALKRGRRRNSRLLNPFGVRFCTGRKGFLSPTRRFKDGAPGLTCTAEITEAVKDDDLVNLGPRKRDKLSSKQIIEAWCDAYTKQFGGDGRLHWGQIQGEFGPDQLAACYPKEDIDAWYEAFRVLNPFGLFDTAFARRLGFIARRDADTNPFQTFRGF